MQPDATITPADTDDPVRAAIADEAIQRKLLQHALAHQAKHGQKAHAQVRLQEAEIICSKLYERALLKRADFDPARGAVGAWLHGLLTNLCYEHYREAQRHQTTPLIREVADRELPESPGELAPFLACLSPRERGIVEGYCFQDLSHQENGRRFGLSESAARQQYRRALLKIKRIAEEGTR